MTSARRAILAFACAVAALLSDWVSGELFMRRDSVTNLIGALSINAVVLATLVGAAYALLSRRAFEISLRTAACTILLAAAISGLPMPLGLKMSIFGVAVALSFVAAAKLNREIADRLIRAVAFASVAFVALPFAWRLAQPAPAAWIGPQFDAGSKRAGTMFLLLDEMSDEAAAPIADEFRQAGLNVRQASLASVGDNTLNVIPRLFGHADFSRARACGRSTICSGANALDFSRVSVHRPDVDVTGLLLPYCDIAGLRSCFQLPLPHEFGSSYKGLANFYLRRLGLPVPAFLRAPAEPPDQQRRLLEMQTEFMARSAYWTQGGILYAHLPVPHPPGLDGKSTLDADYAANLDVARRLVHEQIARSRESFGSDFSIIVTSDHPLRAYWCTSGEYPDAACKPRAAFLSRRVPMIVASPGKLSSIPLDSNERVFDVLNEQSGSVVTVPPTNSSSSKP